MIIDRFNAQPNKHTFLIPPIKKFIELYYKPEDFWLDPFCGEHSPVPHERKNHLNPAIPAGYHLEANEFLKKWGFSSVDGIFLDPPYSLRQMKEVYNSIGIDKIPMEQTQSQIFFYKKEVLRILKLGGIILMFGWNSNCFSPIHFMVKHVRLVNHGGSHNDTICTMQVRTQPDIASFV
jgi:hypothetical protein